MQFDDDETFDRVDTLGARLCQMSYPSKASPESVEMYSFDRVAYCFWYGVIEGLVGRRWSDDKIIEALQSKGVRMILDGGDHERTLQALGRLFAGSLTA